MQAGTPPPPGRTRSWWGSSSPTGPFPSTARAAARRGVDHIDLDVLVRAAPEVARLATVAAAVERDREVPLGTGHVGSAERLVPDVKELVAQIGAIGWGLDAEHPVLGPGGPVITVVAAVDGDAGRAARGRGQRAFSLTKSRTWCALKGHLCLAARARRKRARIETGARSRAARHGAKGDTWSRPSGSTRVGSRGDRCGQGEGRGGGGSRCGPIKMTGMQRSAAAGQISRADQR